MTIAIAMVVPDGIVLAADSKLSISTPQGTRDGSNVSPKVFQLTPTMGITTCGWADFAEGEPYVVRTVSSLIEEFRDRLPEDDAASPEQITHLLGRFFQQKYQDCEVPGPSIELGKDSVNPGPTWDGLPWVIQRLLLGYDGRIMYLPIFHAEDSPLSLEARDELYQQLKMLNARAYYSSWLIQDAIDYAAWLIHQHRVDPLLRRHRAQAGAGAGLR